MARDKARKDWGQLAALADVEGSPRQRNAATRLWAEIERLQGVEAAAGALLLAQDLHVRAEIRAAHDRLVSLLNGEATS